MSRVMRDLHGFSESAVYRFPVRLTLRGQLVGVMLILAVLAVGGWAIGRLFTPGASEVSLRAAESPIFEARPTPSLTAAAVPLNAPLSAAQQRQVDYALTYWKTYNSAAYGDDNPNGGDCANFVSQTLLQRGWTMNSKWFNHGPNAMSSAWAFVPSMYTYLRANASELGLVELGESDRSKYAVGDVVMFWWKNASGGYSAAPDHVQVIDRITTAGGQASISMASHNIDYDFRDLDDEVTTEHPGAKYVVFHLTRDTN
ncbi:hypothetical protein D7I44_12170 [Gryllotalpicola protaetiae]|uniref:Putative amidase domain-containing protein n=1 Tax=Gryllotalpicola protaetiae TaxID=2419771 RepID=A0A387BP11_9MICO|nr:hypothetical protein D7I44_12170 [Gryllotalpicola protaetiae]